MEQLLLGIIPGLPSMVLLRSPILMLPWTGSAVLQTADALHSLQHVHSCCSFDMLQFACTAKVHLLLKSLYMH